MCTLKFDGWKMNHGPFGSSHAEAEAHNNSDLIEEMPRCLQYFEFGKRSDVTHHLIVISMSSSTLHLACTLTEAVGTRQLHPATRKTVSL